MHNFILKKYKLVLSFFKKDWTIEDFPVIVRSEQGLGLVGISEERFKPVPFVAIVLGWFHMQAMGETKEAALSALCEKFNVFKKEEGKLPRPGSEVPLVFASNEKVAKYSSTAEEFLKRILDMNLSETFISDESSIWDFVFDENLNSYYEKIMQVYGVDVRETNGNLVQIFELISKK